MARRDAFTEHFLRRAGFGASPDEREAYEDQGVAATLDEFLAPDSTPDPVDQYIGQPGFVGVTARTPFSPNTVINDARQRWLFRMVHTRRPLQEKMALFWHQHFATAYGKIAGALGAPAAARVMAAKPSEDPVRQRGQIELFRQYALGNFRDLVIEVARDPAMLVWLDGRSNVRGRPQENFARELLELFTLGVGHFTEDDVTSGSRVFTGWNLARVGNRDDPDVQYSFAYNANQHDTGAKTFSFPIYGGGSRTIPARSAQEGQQDGLDLINALAAHPATAERLARQLYAFFVSELTAAPADFVANVGGTYLRSGFDMRATVRAVFESPDFAAPWSMYARYSWPVEFVVRAIKETGWAGFSVNSALAPLVSMGQQLFEPPHVGGWRRGPAWFSTGAVLARASFAATLAQSQRTALRDQASRYRQSPQSLVGFVLDRLTPTRFEDGPYADLLAYVQAGGEWTGSDAQLLTKTAGLVHLVLCSSEYQVA